jgi:tRNA dimethylallyltransferase
MKRFNTNWKNKDKIPIVIIFGPTAVGKTQLITALSNYNIEIINADSMQVYKYMNVGTAKPEEKLRKKIRHQLIDIVKPSYQYNVGDFVRETEKLIPRIYRKKKIPVICGGSAYYIQSFVYGLPNSPKGNKRIRKQLQAEFQDKGKDFLYNELKKIDPQSAKVINPHDRYRIIRALEVFKTARRPLSSFAVPKNIRTDFKILLLGLERDKNELSERIEKRVDWMFKHNLISEIKHLMALGYNENDPGMRGIGYKEFMEMQKCCYVYQDVKERIKQNSKTFAKRQITFFKSLPQVKWIRADEHQSIIACIEDFLNTY